MYLIKRLAPALKLGFGHSQRQVASAAFMACSDIQGVLYLIQRLKSAIERDEKVTGKEEKERLKKRLRFDLRF